MIVVFHDNENNGRDFTKDAGNLQITVIDDVLMIGEIEYAYYDEEASGWQLTDQDVIWDAFSIKL